MAASVRPLPSYCSTFSFPTVFSVCVLLRSPCFYYVCLYFAALGVKRGRRCAIESSFVLSSCWPLYLVLFFSFFQFARKWNVDRRAMFYNLGGGKREKSKKPLEKGG